jgi:hypothetical protein
MRSSVRELSPTMRLLFILVMVVVAAGVVALGGRTGRLPSSAWYELSRQRLMQADLLYRMGLYLDLVMPDEPVPGVGGARQLRERAIADYERDVLSGRPNPAALQRLGIIYAERGYVEQARQAFGRGAQLDDEHAGVFFALAAVYAPEARFKPLTPEQFARLQGQERWLSGIVLPHYYERLGDGAAMRQALQQAQAQTRSFGLRVLVLLVIYGVLGLVGLAILLGALGRWAFTVRPRGPSRPPLIVTWEPLDALETVAVLYFAMSASGVLASLAIAHFLKGAPDVVQVAVIGLQYTLVTIGVLYLIWTRVSGEDRRKLSILGLRGRRPWWLIAQGIGGYAVLVVVLLSLTSLVPGGNLFTPGWAQTGERLLSVAHSPAALVGLFILICVIAPVVEEVIFRGFVYPGLRRRMSVTGAVVVSALLFALMHNNPAALAPIALIGIVLAILYERNLSLVPSIICHALNNTLVFFLMMLTS